MHRMRRHFLLPARQVLVPNCKSLIVFFRAAKRPQNSWRFSTRKRFVQLAEGRGTGDPTGTVSVSSPPAVAAEA